MSTALPDTSIQHVSDTAFLVAHWRALESARPHGLFKDPWAARLAGERGKVLAEAFLTRAMSSWTIAVRTVVIDEYVRAALGRGVDRIVNLGAGLDTRPYRLELPAELEWVEVDYPELIRFKEQHLAADRPRCTLRRVGLDLADLPARRALLASVTSGARRSLLLTEGLVPYLDLGEAAALADDLRALPDVDGWVVDYVSPESHRYRQRAGLSEQMRQAPFKFQPEDWFAFFADHGWRAREERYLPEEGRRRGRPPPLPWGARLLSAVLGPLVPPERRSQFQRFAGYILLEPVPAA
jgi:methyltransferase (TIGR00027 family)